MLDDSLTMDGAVDTGGWTVAGVMTGLEGALLTTQVAEAGLAGTVEMAPELRDAANDESWEGALP
jgi:hypothetical protein